MTKREALRQTHQKNTLLSLGFTREESEQLRRISMTLRRWYELECGDSNNYGSWAIERDDVTDLPFMVRHYYRHGMGKDTVSRNPIADRESGAKRRLAAIIGARNTRVKPADGQTRIDPIRAYLQTDPRGASLYILRPGDVPEGQDDGAYYNRGICVY